MQSVFFPLFFVTCSCLIFSSCRRMQLSLSLSPSHPQQTCTLTGMYTAFSTTASSSNKSFVWVLPRERFPRLKWTKNTRRDTCCFSKFSASFFSSPTIIIIIIIIMSLAFLSFIQLHRTQRFVPEISVIQSCLPWHLQSCVHHFSFVTEERTSILLLQRILTWVPQNSTRFLCRIWSKISFIFWRLLISSEGFWSLATLIIMVTLEWALISHNRHQEIISRERRTEVQRFQVKGIKQSVGI